MDGPSNRVFSMHVNAMTKEFVELVVEFQNDINHLVKEPFASKWHEAMYVADVAATAAGALMAFAYSAIDNQDWDGLLNERMADVKRMIKENQEKARASGIMPDIKAPKNTAN